MRSTTGRHHGQTVMVKAATQGTIPTEGPLSGKFKPGNGEQMNKVEYDRELAVQLCGRPERKTEQLREGHWKLLGRGEEDLADTVECEKERYKRLLEFMEKQSNNPENIPPDASRNPVFERKNNSTETSSDSETTIEKLAILKLQSVPIQKLTRFRN